LLVQPGAVKILERKLVEGFQIGLWLISCVTETSANWIWFFCSLL